jgi:hypothetical protein
MLYPSPATDKLNFRMSTLRSEKVSLVISNLGGKIIYTKEITVNNSGQEHTINVENWPSQLYFVKVLGSNNEVLTTQKFVKQ